MAIFVRFELDNAVWAAIPPFWGGESWSDEHAWAREMAQNCWTDSGFTYQQVDLDRVEAVLAMCAEKWGPGSVHPEHAVDPNLLIDVLLHFPDPRELPIPVRLLVAEGERLDGDLPSLRTFVVADDPLAIDPPEVTEFEHPTLENGLRAFRHREARPEPGETFDPPVYAVLRYAFPVPGHRAVVLVDVSWGDLGRLAAAQDDIEKLVLSLTWTHYPDGPVNAE